MGLTPCETSDECRLQIIVVLIILDEIQRIPESFPQFRGLIDKERQEGNKSALFLFLGSASMDLLKQSSESLAGRISYFELFPINILEIEKRHEKIITNLKISHENKINELKLEFDKEIEKTKQEILDKEKKKPLFKKLFS